MELSTESLFVSWQHVRRGSRSAGVDGMTVDLFSANLQHQLQILLLQLQQERYAARPLKGFYVPKASGGKRLLGIQTVRDRLVARWLLDELYWPLENTFQDNSYAYRPGRGIQAAVRHFGSYYKSGSAWVIKADIEKFFDRLCWALLLSQVEKLAPDDRLVSVIEAQLKAGFVLKGRYFNPGQGVAQGAVLSGALANLYLNEFDRRCLDSRLRLVRYGDDFAIACDSWQQAQQVLERIREWLGTVYLSLQADKTHVYSPEEEFIFLGHRFSKGQLNDPMPSTPLRYALRAGYANVRGRGF